MWLELDSFYQFWNVNLYQLQFVWLGKVLMADRYLLIHSQAYGKLIVIYNYHMGNFKKKYKGVNFVKFTVFISARVVWNWNQNICSRKSSEPDTLIFFFSSWNGFTDLLNF